MAKVKTENYKVIDPMAKILHGKAYIIWCEIHHPHEPARIEDVIKLFDRISSNDKDLIVKQAKDALTYSEKLKESSNAIIQAAGR